MCSFCGKSHSEVRKLIAGPGVYICDSCIVVCKNILDKEINEDSETQISDVSANDTGLKVPDPITICKKLDDYVIGQDHAKKVLSVAVHNHYKRILHDRGELDSSRAKALKSDQFSKLSKVELEKSNVLLLGPTGSGKTLLARTLAKVLNVPFCIADATTLTEAGYVGEDVENIILRLLQTAENDVGKAELGIIYIDEIDKIGRNTENVSITRICNVPPQGGRKHPQQDYIQVNTEKILFICGGAFVGLEDVIKRRLGKGIMGFKSDDESSDKLEKNKSETLRLTEPEDLLGFGLIPEFIGRLPIISTLDELSEEQLIRILTEPKNAMLKQYQKLIALEGAELNLTKDALQGLAQEAVKRGTGARALRSIFEKLMLDIMYELPSNKDIKKISINRSVVEGKKSPVLRKKAKKDAA